ncbi:hypothetical protein Psal006b_01498 [Piscirickettsia salmonis]|uniref:Thioesterase n=3 Tax=Piscirickettsia salmonis TaxID=1238 RepID=A0A1L6THG7_PISSA|nr:DUF4442 domain-containing protein [Piscirickettsia salmonis]ALB22889.1 thioesterase [Piscirickettsia salmonis]ALT18783.1 thioesterase [Piscirickettsia salmonis LF-89 = ATCC VR-1361]ALY04239.1 thioesterase [Piscirickettsia salmonis]AMA43796.1 thioesterase [Piscirickettsia salmonis]AOS36722.1 thioesterase [Piscirickettsia salmonis]
MRRKITAMCMRSKIIPYLFRLWPPFWGTGIRVDFISTDFRQIRVSMKLRFYNKNYVGIHFGGSLYSMIDPFYILMLVQILGPQYKILDQAAHITYLKPGLGTVYAHFQLNDDVLNQVRVHTEAGEKYLLTLPVDIVDDQSNVIAHIDKTIYIRQRQRKVK